MVSLGEGSQSKDLCNHHIPAFRKNDRRYRLLGYLSQEMHARSVVVDIQIIEIIKNSVCVCTCTPS